MTSILDSYNSFITRNKIVKDTYIDECLEKYIDASYKVNKFIYRGLDERYKKVFVECIIPEPFLYSRKKIFIEMKEKLNKNISIDNCRNINKDYIKCDVYDK